jgi:hypothetical protein
VKARATKGAATKGTTWTFQPVNPSHKPIKVQVSREVPEEVRFAIQMAILDPPATPPPLATVIHELILLACQVEAISDMAVDTGDCSIDVVRALHRIGHDLAAGLGDLQDRVGDLQDRVGEVRQ